MKHQMRIVLILLFVVSWSHACFAADLMIFSGAGLMKPVEELRRQFEQTFQVRTDIHYGGSGELFGLLAVGRPCDVLIPGSEKAVNDALKNGWVLEETVKKLVRHVPVVIVQHGNPKGIQGIADLTRPNLKVAIGDPKGPAIGQAANQIFKRAGILEKVKPNVSVYAPTVNQLLIYVTLKQVDAAIIWKDMATWAEARGKIEVISIPQEQNMIKTIPAAVATKAPHNDLAVQFTEYIASDQGFTIWEKWGFEPCGE